MKSILCFLLAITLALCQAGFGPAVNPSTSNCASTYTCVKDAGFCGANISQSANYYCGKANYFCDYAFSTNCKAKGALNAPCNSTVYTTYQDCQLGLYCSAGACTAPPTVSTTPAPTYTIVYEGGACDTTSNFCDASLDCVSSKCVRWYSVAATGTCTQQDDCQPGLVCASSTCTAQTNSIVVGGACKADSDCGTQFSPLNCICNSPGASAGICGSLQDPTIFTAAGVTNCAALLNAYKNYATITKANAAGALAAANCVATCQQLNGISTVETAWQGYNYVISATDCVYTAPTACANPTTTSANSKSSAATVFASALLIFVALLF